MDDHAEDVPFQLVHVRGEQEGEHGGGTGPRARCSPSRSPGLNTNRGRCKCAALGKFFAPTPISTASCRRGASGGALCRPTSATPPARWSIAVPWRERPPFWTAWPAKPAASEVVAHATLYLPQPSPVVVGRVRSSGGEGVWIRVVHSGGRLEIVRLATRALKALRASSISLRPRCARLTALTARAATRPWATIDGIRKCHTQVLDDVHERRYSRIIFAGCDSRPLHIARCGARSNRRSQATVRSPLLKPLPRCLFVRCHVRETDNRIGLRFGPRPGADPTVHHTSNHHAATAVRLSEVDASGDALSAPIQHEQQRHRRSEWAGVSWPKDDDHERDAAGGIGLDLA